MNTINKTKVILVVLSQSAEKRCCNGAGDGLQLEQLASIANSYTKKKKNTWRVSFKSDKQ